MSTGATNGGGTILELKDVHTFYGSIQALKGISIDVRKGEIVTLIGANGAGKSTTLRSINGLNRPRRGTINFQGREITNAPTSPRGDSRPGRRARSARVHRATAAGTGIREESPVR